MTVTTGASTRTWGQTTTAFIWNSITQRGLAFIQSNRSCTNKTESDCNPANSLKEAFESYVRADGSVFINFAIGNSLLDSDSVVFFADMVGDFGARCSRAVLRSRWIGLHGFHGLLRLRPDVGCSSMLDGRCSRQDERLLDARIRGRMVHFHRGVLRSRVHREREASRDVCLCDSVAFALLGVSYLVVLPIGAVFYRRRTRSD